MRTGDGRVGRGKAVRLRLAVVAACLVYGLVALYLGRDRDMANRADPAPPVPQVLSAKALEAQGWAAMNAGNWPLVARIGTQLVLREPVEPVASAILGAGRDGMGDANGAAAAFGVARHMGWRVGVTQRYWLSHALAQGDYQTASAHADAMLRQRPYLMSDRDILDPLERSDKGQQALAMRLAAKPDWLSPYASNLADVSDDIVLVRASVLNRAARQGLVAGCDVVAKLALRLVQQGQARLAAQVWHNHCPEAGAGLITDGNFASATFMETVTPFDWQFYSNADVDTALVRGPSGGKWLTISTSAPSTRIVAMQYLVVLAGTYRLSWASAGHTGADTPMVVASLDCGRDSDQWLSASFDPASQRWVAEVRLGDTCPGKWLNFAVRPGVAAGAGVHGGDVSLGAVALEPVAAH